MNRMTVFLALAGAISPCAARKVRVDFSHTSNFSCYKTYSWVQPPEIDSASPVFPNQLMQERVQRFVDQALSARGLKRIPAGGDLLVGYRINVTEQPQFTTFTNSLGTGWGWGCCDWNGWGWSSSISTTTVDVIYLGTLVVDLQDARQKQLVFQGVSKQTISSRPERNTKRLAKAVNEIFEKYPPRT
jgi:hypothetical protein